MWRSSDDLLRLALFYPTAPFHHVLAPALHERVPNVLDPEAHRAVIRATEECGFDYLFLADSWATFGPISKAAGIVSPHLSSLVMASFAAACTRHIGIVNTMHLCYLPPVAIARFGANLDALTGGRWGINIVSGNGFAEGLVPGPARELSHDERYALAQESMDIVLQLWAGERVEHEGKYFSVVGELIAPLPVQRPHPAIVSAGSSPAGLELAARYADYLFVPSAGSPERIAAAHARVAGAKLQTNLVVLLRDSDDEAHELAASLRAAVDTDVVREYVDSISGVSTTYRGLLDERREEELRDLGTSSNVAQLAGSPETVAAGLIALHRDVGIRGLALNFTSWHPSEIRRFSTQVMPLLAEAGVWRSPRERGWSW